MLFSFLNTADIQIQYNGDYGSARIRQTKLMLENVTSVVAPWINPQLVMLASHIRMLV